MNKNEKILILINCLFNLATAMSAVFVNVYLYAYTGSLVVMTIYCMIRIGLFPIFFTIGGKWAQRQNFSQTLSAGLLSMMASLVFILFANDMFAVQPDLVYLVAVFVGTGEGLFWLSVNSLNQIVSSVESRAQYVGNIGIFNNIASIIAPFISTLLISSAGSDTDGYINIFKIVLFVYAVIVIVSTKIKVTSSRQSFSVIKKMRFKNDPQWKYCLVSTFFYGMRDSLTLTLAGLLVYNATGGSGAIYGQLLAFFAIITIISYFFVSRIMKKKNRMKFYNIGAVLISSSTIALVIFPNIYGAIYYGVVNAIATPMYGNPYSIIMMNAIQDYMHDENIIGRVIVKETYLSFGRCFGMLMIVIAYLVLPENMYLVVSVLFCSMFPIVLVLYANNYYKNREKRTKVVINN